MRAVRSERGQSAVLAVLFMTVLLGMTALVLDVGSWYRADRRLQAIADAAALAGAQLLPEDPGWAREVALEYAAKNGGGVTDGDIAIRTTVVSNDTIAVSAGNDAPGFFSRIFGIVSVQVAAEAEARSANARRARWVAPIAISEHHPLLNCVPDPCFEQSTTLPLARPHDPEGPDAPGSFGLVQLEAGSNSSPILASWLRDGYGGTLGPGPYLAATGAKFNSSEFRDAMNARLGDEILFPVFRSLTGTGSNAVYDIIGWVAFVPESFTTSGSAGTITGRFVRATWDADESDDPNAPDFGVRTVILTR
jgi:hypothetical protein